LQLHRYSIADAVAPPSGSRLLLAFNVNDDVTPNVNSSCAGTRFSSSSAQLQPIATSALSPTAVVDPIDPTARSFNPYFDPARNAYGDKRNVDGSFDIDFTS
jgi:hypothetical protein